MNIINRFVLSAALGLGLAVLLFPVGTVAQTFASALNNTTLNGAINATQPTLVLTSASAIAQSSYGAPAAGQWLYFADGTNELQVIKSVSSTTVTLASRKNGFPHATLVRLFTGNASAPDFQKVDPTQAPGIGNINTCASNPLVWINIVNGNVWVCKSNAYTATNPIAITYNSVAPGLPAH